MKRAMVVAGVTAWLSFANAVTAAEVALDIGHTLAEPGVITERGVSEFELNRALATDLAAALSQTGVEVNLLNADGLIASLTQRTALAAGESLYISLHHDSTQARFRPVNHPRFRGYSLWVSDQRATLAASLRCAGAIGDRLLLAGFQPSHYHAHPVWGEKRRMLDARRGIFANPHLAVLRTARSPAVLIEAGVVANPDEEKWLARAEVHAALVRALTDGIAACADVRQRTAASRASAR